MNHFMTDTEPHAQGSYPQNLLEQPDAVRATIAGLSNWSDLSPYADRLAAGQFRNVVLTGMGASYAALQPITLDLVAQGMPAQRIETSELLYHTPRLLDAQTLVIIVSQSGASAEILRLMERTRPEHISVIGVTNTADSPLAQGADAVVLMRAGAEFSVSSKTYVATLAALQLLGNILCGRDPNPGKTELEHTADAMVNYLTRLEEYVSALVQILTPIRQLAIVGRGPSLAAVGAGALIIQEAAKFPCLGMSSAALRHGPLELISPELFVLVYRGIAPTQDLNARLAADIRERGAHAVLVAESADPDVFSLPPVAPVTLPLVEILVPQMISLALARLRGRTAGQFEQGGKVTLTE